LGPQYCKYASDLHLISQSESDFGWGDFQQAKLDLLKDEVLQNLKIFHPDWERPFVLRVDSSRMAAKSLINVLEDGKRVPIGFFSEKLEKAKRKKGMSVIEDFANRRALEYFEFYLRGYEVTIETDHSPLLKLNNGKFGNEKVENWFEDLRSKFNFQIVHIKGKDMKLVDSISRLFVGEVNVIGGSLDWVTYQIFVINCSYVQQNLLSKF